MLVHTQQQAWDKASHYMMSQDLAIYTLVFHSEVFLLCSTSVFVPFLSFWAPEDFLLHSRDQGILLSQFYLVRNQLNSETFLLSLIKTEDYVFLIRPPAFWDGPHSDCEMFLSKYPSFCLLLNSFCDETSKTSSRLKIRCVISIKRPWVQVPAWVLTGLESQLPGFTS